MTEAPFLALVLEEIAVRGLDCSNQELRYRIENQLTDDPPLPDPKEFADWCVQEVGIAALTPRDLSLYDGVPQDWVRVHEAGHAIVGMKFRIPIRAICFYNGGTAGKACLVDPDWRGCADEGLLENLLTVDVAGNIAQLMYPGCEPPEARISALYHELNHVTKYAPDLIVAHVKLLHLETLIRGRTGERLEGENSVEMRRTVLQEAEREAERILREIYRAFERLVLLLKNGALRGATIRQSLGS